MTLCPLSDPGCGDKHMLPAQAGAQAGLYVRAQGARAFFKIRTSRWVLTGMLRAGNSGDGMADLLGVAAAPVRQRLEGCGGVGRVLRGGWRKVDQDPSWPTRGYRGARRDNEDEVGPKHEPPPTSNVTLE